MLVLSFPLISLIITLTFAHSHSVSPLDTFDHGHPQDRPLVNSSVNTTEALRLLLTDSPLQAVTFLFSHLIHLLLSCHISYLRSGLNFWQCYDCEDTGSDDSLSLTVLEDAFWRVRYVLPTSLSRQRSQRELSECQTSSPVLTEGSIALQLLAKRLVHHSSL